MSGTLQRIRCGAFSLLAACGASDLPAYENRALQPAIDDPLGCPAGKPCAGYTLLGSPENDSGAGAQAMLIDMQGNVVHRWSITGFPPRMLPGGSVVGCTGVVTDSYDCVELEQRSWDDQLEWSFSGFAQTETGPAARQHHDWQREGNPIGSYAPGQDFVEHGKTLVLAHMRKNVPAIRAGDIDDDVIYEVDGDEHLTSLVWQAADHVDEFGLDEAARADIASRTDDVLEWLHSNAMSRLGENHWFDEGHFEFDPDNIMYSSRNGGFFLIIDHTTGNVVWRVGPDFAGRPEESLGQFAGQHHPHMIPRGLPGAGNILVFDNGGPSGYGGGDASNPNQYRYARDYSRVLEFNPVTFELIWEYGSASGSEFFSSLYISSADRLPNGNTLITIGTAGTLIEVTPDKRIVWQYQYQGGADTASWVYRAYRIPAEWLPDGQNTQLAGYKTWASQYPAPSP